MVYKTWTQVYNASLKHGIVELMREEPKIRPNYKLSATELKAIAACEAVGLEFWALAPDSNRCWGVSDGLYWDVRYDSRDVRATVTRGLTLDYSHGTREGTLKSVAA